MIIRAYCRFPHLRPLGYFQPLKDWKQKENVGLGMAHPTSGRVLVFHLYLRRVPDWFPVPLDSPLFDAWRLHACDLSLG